MWLRGNTPVKGSLIFSIRKNLSLREVETESEELQIVAQRHSGLQSKGQKRGLALSSAAPDTA
jgi:hypothetical protein